MNKTSSFDFCIIGAGLAGLAMAGELQSRGAKVIVIDKNEIASGASGTPIGLVNPATGRFGTKSWRAEECYKAILDDLEKIQAASSQSFFKKSGILRPATDEKIAHKMRENLEKTPWPEGWCFWLNEREIKMRHDEIRSVEGGLWLPIGLTVDIPSYLKSKAGFLKNNGVTFKLNSHFEFRKTDRQFEISASGSDIFFAKSVIFCAGIGTKTFADWNFLPLIPVKGQVATFKKLDSEIPDFAISALGYISSIKPDTFVIGSTYEHHFEHPEPDQKGLNYMINRLNKVYPNLFEGADLISQWSGVRASTPNRMPILGRHPEDENLYVFAGLGSKGLLYSSFLSSIFGDHIVNSAKLPKEVEIDRFLK